MSSTHSPCVVISSFPSCPSWAALSSLPHAPPALSAPLILAPASCSFLLSISSILTSSCLSSVSFSCCLNCWPFLLLSLVLLCPFLLRRPDNKPISSLGFLSFLLHRFLPSLLLDCSLPCVQSFAKCPSDDWARFFPLPSSQQLQNLFFFITFRHLFLRDPTWPGGVPPAPMFGAIRTRSSPLSLVSFCFPL